MSANVDPNEIDKFARIASRWWEPESEFKPLHEINPLRLQFIRQGSQGLQRKTVLDVGCGGGILSEGLAAEGAQVSGIDMAAESLEVARLHLLESGHKIDYQQCTAEEFAATHSRQFEVVTCMEMLEHVPEPESVIQACADLACDAGEVFFSTINRNPKAFAQAIIGAEYLLNLLPRGTHEYQRFIRPSEMAHEARKAGLEVIALKGIQYQPLTRKYRLSDDVQVNYLMHCRKNA